MTANCEFTALTHAHLVDELTQLIWRAAAAVLAIDQSTVKWHAKADLSPVSVADEAANAVITQGLLDLLPGVPIVSEEGSTRKGPRVAADFALVDPLDGTREFLAGRDEFTVNIAIVLDGAPILGLIAAPALRLIWRGISGRGAECLHLAAGDDPHQASEIRPLRTREAVPGGFVAAVSRSHFANRRVLAPATHCGPCCLWLIAQVLPHRRGQRGRASICSRRGC
jgi:3'(2'), 5'-bisphosphate nucleotidase